MQSGRIVNRGHVSGINETCNDTIAGVVAQLNRESNQKSETGGDESRNEDWLREKRAAKMDLGGPGGTGSSGPTY